MIVDGRRSLVRRKICPIAGNRLIPHCEDDSSRGNHGYVAADQVFRQRRHPVQLALGLAVFNREILALDEACIL
jgi:hypothetical protein